VWIIISVLLSLFIPKTFFLSIEGYFYLLPYFTLGYGVSRYGKVLFVALIIRMAFIAFLFGFTIHQLIWFEILNISHVEISALGLCVGMNWVFLVFYFRFNIPLLAKLGSYSYTVYLYHGFGISVAFKMMGLLGLHEMYFLEFLLKMIVGIGVGLLVDNIANRYSITKRLFLGKY